MHDVKWIKDNIDLFDKAMERLGIDSISLEVTSLYQEYVILLSKLQTLQNERNNLSKTIGMKKSKDFFQLHSVYFFEVLCGFSYINQIYLLL